MADDGRQGATDQPADGAPPPSRQAVDLSVLDVLVEQIGGGEQARQELIDTYLGDADSRITALMAAVVAGDTEAAGRAAHGLRSSSALVGALPLAALLLESETMARAGTGDLRAAGAGIQAEYLVVAATLQGTGRSV